MRRSRPITPKPRGGYGPTPADFEKLNNAIVQAQGKDLLPPKPIR